MTNPLTTVTPHAECEPVLVGSMNDSPPEAARRMGWEVVRRMGSGVRAKGKAGIYFITRTRGSCWAQPVAS